MQDASVSVDVKFVENEREREQVREARELRLEFGNVRVARPEDTVAYKVLFGTEQDLQDAHSIVARQGERLDRVRLSALARSLDVAAGVDQLLEDVDQLLSETE